MAWDGIVAVDLFMAGLGAWIYIVAVIMDRRRPLANKTLLAEKIAAWLCVLVGVATLMIDARGGLTHPLRLFGLLTNLHSVMAWGVIFISCFMILGFFDVVVQWRTGKRVKWLAVLAALFALGVSAYTGALLGAAGTVPLWNIPLLPLMFISSAIATGSAAAYLIAAALERDALAGHGWVHVLLCAALAAVAVLGAVLLGITGVATGVNAPAGARAVANLVAGPEAVVFLGGALGVGIIVPLVCEAFRKASKGRYAEGGALSVAEMVCVLIGGFCMRYAVVMAAVSIGCVL